MRNSFALDFFSVINRLSVRFEPFSFGFGDRLSLIAVLDDGIGELLPNVIEGWCLNGECGRRQPLDQLGILAGNLEERFPPFIGADFVPVNGEGD